jgi:small conductance mechanosensitive channel
VVVDQIVEWYERTLTWFTATTPRTWLLFLLLLVVTWMAARLVARHLLSRLLAARRVELAISQLLGRLFVAAAIIVGLFVYAYALFSANLAALATALGLVSLAVGFGLQNTIANIAGGISLAVDRPFRIGDQIQVGQMVGDVQEIGIRSTRILTRRKEYIVIPNKFIEEQPVTNFTMVYPELRLDVPVRISYESDRTLAEEIMVEAAAGHPVVLRKPAPRVLLRDLGDSGVDLELRCWITHPRSRSIVTSDLLKSIQDRFEAEGIHIPYPHRTLLQKSDLPKPTRRARQAAPIATPPPARVLLALAGGLPPQNRVEYAVGLAKALRAPVVGLFVGAKETDDAREEANRALHLLGREAEAHALWFKPILRFQAELSQAVVDVSQEEDVDLVVVGLRPHAPIEWGLRHEHVEPDHVLRQGLKPPLHEVPPHARLDPRTVAHLQERIREYRKDRLAPKRPGVVVSPPEPTVSAVPAPLPESPAAEAREPEKGGPRTTE